MTVQREDIEPETQRGVTSDWRHDPHFKPPQRMPWSKLGPNFIKAWGHADPKNPQPEHVEIIGQTGSGKSYLMCTMLQQRAKRLKRSACIVCTKKADATFDLLGWPTVDSLDEAHEKKYANFIYWPRTSAVGSRRKSFYEAKITDLLSRLWKPQADITVAFDEIGFMQSLGEVNDLVQMYWREARSIGIDVVGMKQRPQGALRDMHSESYWTFAFKPKDRADAERWAELFGAKRDWMPVLDDLDRAKREFIVANPLHDEAFISWIDEELHPVKANRETPPYAKRRP